MAGIEDALNGQSGTGQNREGISIKSFVASLATASIVFGVEFILFILIKGKLTRIYQPRTYLVPERERTDPSPAGLLQWMMPVFRTSNSEFIQKCGLDAYFFLRYLRMLIKIFLPLGCLILPILIPLNKVGGKDQDQKNLSAPNGTRYNVTGLDQLGWGNVRPENANRYWGHLVLAVVVVVYVCAVFFDELRGYIRLRQSYLTSPQHRIRASATTVLVTAIPTRWLSVEALDGLYDVFPGGVRNIWINRNFDDLNEKVKERNQIALALEAAETELIKKCKKAQLKTAHKESKKAGRISKADAKQEQDAADKKAEQLAAGPGVSAGNPQEAHTVEEELEEEGRPSNASERRDRFHLGEINDGLGVVTNGMGRIGKTVLGGFRNVGNDVDDRFTAGGLVLDTTPQARVEAGNAHAPQNEVSHDPAESPTVSGAVRRPSGKRKPGQSPMSPTFPTVPEDEDNMMSAGTRPNLEKRTSSFWRRNAAKEGDEYPLTQSSPETNGALEKKSEEKTKEQEYPPAYSEDFQEDDYGEPLWKKYIKEKHRETMRLPIFGWSWMPSLPLLGKKVDKIYHCRKELARLNLEIEIDQQEPEKFPLMNSAFIQFNHQVAAHMACQCLSHHVPKQMAPRVVEISPDDVIWDNMSIKWWERYLRTTGVVIIVCGMVIGWAIPVAFTGLLSQISYLEDNVPWLHWLATLPEWFISAVQGVLPPLLLAILMAILPLILRFLSKAQGVHTGMAVELTVQTYYFAFLFVQLFLVVSISSGFSSVFKSLTNVANIPDILAQNIPNASNYFFSYMILQAMSVSAGALVQIVNLISWFILAPILDNTARMKWARTTNLNQMQWGTFFPVYTTLASIGLIYCIVSPLIMVFNVITFTLFWIVYRYNTLYVTRFRFDTGGLLFPKAINQLFTGLYVMEICLIGLFFLVSCEGQAICMIVVLILTVLFQWFLNEAFNPLFRYLPITLEDDASRRDEEFARAQRQRLGLEEEDEEEEEEEEVVGLDDNAGPTTHVDIELHKVGGHRIPGSKYVPNQVKRAAKGATRRSRTSWADRSNNRHSKYFGTRNDASFPSVERMREKLAHDTESQGTSTKAIGHALFSGIHDELEDLTPDERDQLVQRAFQHEALRAKRPVVWLPRDDLGVSDDEIFRTQRLSKHIWVSNEYQALDGKCRPIFSRSPPDFSEVDLIQL